MPQEYTIEVITREGERRVFEISKGQNLLGSSSRASVPLPDIRDLAKEHLLLIPEAKGCWVSTHKMASLQPSVGGRAHPNGLLKWGTEFYLGELLCRLVANTIDPDETASKQTSPSAVIVFGSMGIAAVVLWMTFGQDGAGPAMATRKDFLSALEKEMFDQNRRCDLNLEAPEHVHILNTRAESAFAKAERYPFEPSDGVEALSIYGKLNACLKSAQDEEMRTLRTNVKHREQSLLQKIHGDFSFYRANLQRALRDDNPNDALKYIRKLRRMGIATKNDDMTTLKEMEEEFVVRAQ